MGCLRVIGRFLCIMALLFIICLLLLDPADRRPFVRDCISTGSRFIEDGSRRIRVTVEEVPEGSAQEVRADLEANRASTAHPPIALPADLLAAIEEEITKNPDHETLILWRTMRGATDRQQQLDMLEIITRRLDEDWWPVDGRLTYELDLVLVVAGR